MKTPRKKQSVEGLLSRTYRVGGGNENRGWGSIYRQPSAPISLPCLKAKSGMPRAFSTVFGKRCGLTYYNVGQEEWF